MRDLLLDCLEEASDMVGEPRSDTLAEGEVIWRAMLLREELGVATTIPEGMDFLAFSAFFRGMKVGGV